MAAPSGRQVELVAGGSRAVVVEVGGGLRAFSVDGTDVLDGYDESAMAESARGQVLVPWPNRLQDGTWSWQGRELQLPLSEPKFGNASHGLARWLSWRVDSSTATTASLSAVIAPQAGWPFRLGVSTTYSLAPGALSVMVSVRNEADEPAPVGLGMHPYFSAGTALVDEATLTLRAGTALTTDARNIPDGEIASTGWSGPIGTSVVDTAYGELGRDADGLARVTLSGPSRTVTIWLDEAWKWVQVFTGDTLPAARRRRGVAIEPLTCPANALRTGRDLVVLAPGQSLTGRWGLEVSSQG